ncbi:MAG: AzlC family ABC transporter permease [Actinomycetota bacterium]
MRRLIPEGSQLTVGELITLFATYFGAGVAVAVVLVEAGTEQWVVVVFAVIINSATAQLAYVAAIEGGGSTVTAMLSGWLVSTRFGLLAAAIAPRLWRSGWQRYLALHNVFDPNTAVADREADDDTSRRVFTRSTLALTPAWFLGCTLGTALSDRIGDPQRIGLDVVLPALLLAIIWPQMRNATGRRVAAAAAVLAIGLAEVTPGGLSTIIAVSAAGLVLLPETEPR